MPIAPIPGLEERHTQQNDKINQLVRELNGLDIPAAVDAAALAALIHAAASKTPPVDADELPLADSAASWGLKKLTWANLKATLKTYFDSLYAAAGSYVTTARTISTTAPLAGGGDLSADRTLAITTVTSIASGSLPAAATAPITGIPATYFALLLVFEGLTTNSASGRPILRVSINNGSSYLNSSGDYHTAQNGAAPAATTSVNLATGASAASATCDGHVLIYGYAQAHKKFAEFINVSTETADSAAGFCLINTTSAIDAIRLETVAGSFDGGTYTLYGLA